MPLDDSSTAVLDRPSPTDRRVDLALERDFSLGAMAVSPSAREVRLGDRRELLEPRVMQVLARLAAASGSVVSRDQLITCCWEGRIVGEDAINRVIARLRRLSETDDGASFTIETIPRVGYRLWPAEPEAVPEAAEAPVEPPAAEAPRPARRRAAVLATVGALVVLAALALLAARPGGPLGGATRQATLVVLPFEDLSPGGGQAYFAEGVAEEIQGSLAAEPSVRVLGRTTSRHFRGETDLARIREALNVSHVLEGSVRRTPSTVRLNVRLLRASDGVELWAGKYDRPPGDLLAVQDEIGGLVAGELGGALTGRRASARTEIAAYDLVLAARDRVRSRTPADIDAARAMLKQATEIDPNYGPAWADLAAVTLLTADSLHGFGRTPAHQARAEAREHARRAVALAPGRADAHAALAAVSEGPAAVAQFREAVRLDPSRSDLKLALARAVQEVGDLKEAEALVRQAEAADPLDPAPPLQLSRLLGRLGRFTEAENAIKRFEALHRKPGHAAMARAFLALERGDWSEAVRQGEFAHRVPDGPRRPEVLGRSYRVLGLPDRARGLAGLTNRPFETAVYARNDAEALRLAAQDPALGDDPDRRWMLADIRIRNGRWREVAADYDRRFPAEADYCRSRETGDAPSVVAALQSAGRRAEARVIADCAQRLLLAEWRQGLERPRSAFSMFLLSASTGDDSSALAWLERAYADGFRGQYHTADPLDGFAPARWAQQPRFHAVRRRLLTHVQAERHQAEAEKT